MKKLLLIVIISLMVVLVLVTIINGITIGNLKILGIKEIKRQDEELDVSISQATKLANTDYQRKIDDLNDAIRTLENEKQNYEDIVSVSTDSEVQAANQSYDNKIEFLLVRIDNHAKTEGVTMKMDVTTSSSGATNVYNLNFIVSGGYAQIEEFVTDIEDDSKLGYKIEDFKMIASSSDGSEVQATFLCKDITISGISSNTTLDTITDKTTENVVTE